MEKPSTPAGTHPWHLNPTQRAAALDYATSNTVDILVIGGGVVGAGIALDAASRGLSTAIVEQRDWAWGTSSRSSKLIHGGIRYLEQGHLPLVTEALTERGLLTGRIAPHLVHDIPFLYPLTRGRWERPYTGLGMTVYDTLSRLHRGPGKLPGHSHLTATAVTRLAPGLNPDAHHGGLVYHDAGVDDARLVLALIATSVSYGAHAISGAGVTSITHDAGGHATGATITLRDTGATAHIRARHIIVAAGPSTSALTAMLAGDSTINVTASKGVHILVPKDRITSRTGILKKTPQSVLFIIPWHSHWIIGTTDTPWDLSAGIDPTATADDIDYLLDQANELLATPLTPSDITGVYAGLRPLISGNGPDTPTTTLSREHLVTTGPDGVTLIAGGKYTTYRVMAADAITHALGPDATPSTTADIPLIGARQHDAAKAELPTLAEHYHLPLETVTHLFSRYGDQTANVLALTDEAPALRQPLPGAPAYLRVEVVYAARVEGATTLEDVLARRTRISIEGPDYGLVASGPTARLLAAELGWNTDDERAALDSYQEYITHQAEAVATLTGHRPGTLTRDIEPADSEDDF